MHEKRCPPLFRKALLSCPIDPEERRACMICLRKCFALYSISDFQAAFVLAESRAISEQAAKNRIKGTGQT